MSEKKTRRVTWTFQPAPDVIRAVEREEGSGEDRSSIINRAILTAFGPEADIETVVAAVAGRIQDLEALRKHILSYAKKYHRSLHARALWEELEAHIVARGSGPKCGPRKP